MYKYRGYTGLASWLSDLLISKSLSFTDKDWNLLCSMPSSWSHVKERGYLHLAGLCREIAKYYSIPYRCEALACNKERPAQTQICLADRMDNVAGSFFCKTSAVYGRRILLIDDVLTTGASAAEATNCLLNAGAISVDLLTIAKSSKFRNHRIGNSKWK